MKICFAASSGGHLEEITCLKTLSEEHETFLLTEGTDSSGYSEWATQQNVYYVTQVNRKEPLFLLNFLKIFIQSIQALRKEKPDCVISTGALATFPVCLLAKLLRIKVIYIESFARVEQPSLTGKIIYRFADLFIVQWEDLLKYYPKAVFTGRLF